MRSVKYYFILTLLLAGLSSCDQDFLERAPGVNLTEDDVFSDAILTSQFADNSYNFRVANDYMRFANNASTSQLSDEAVSGNNHQTVTPFYQGLYHNANHDIGNVWDTSYEGIRNCNIVLSKFDDVPWTADHEPDRIKGEQHFLRAYYYFELIKRFGGVPIFDRPYGVNENVDIPRNSFDEVVEFILGDLDQAERLLPPVYSTANFGRVTSGTAMALRSRVTLYAASPRENSANDLEKWRVAAAAAKSLIDLNQYTLHPDYSELLNVSQSNEYIWIHIRGPRQAFLNFFNFAIKSPASGGDSGTMNPTQNHVDLYIMQETGLPITDPESGYDPQNPYEGRDSRFYSNILYNGVEWQGRVMEMWDGGTDYRQGNNTFSATRYYNRKYWPEVYGPTETQLDLLNFIYFRYGEVLLNYAEAQNEAVGPDQSVYDAINEIRERVDMPPVQQGQTQEEMREIIRNERAVELAFEDHRWYDIMRWKQGENLVAQPFYGMNVILNDDGSFNYSPVQLPGPMQRVFEDYMHYYPIPRREIEKSAGVLEQNPGW